MPRRGARVRLRVKRRLAVLLPSPPRHCVNLVFRAVQGRDGGGDDGRVRRAADDQRRADLRGVKIKPVIPTGAKAGDEIVWKVVQ